jgi:hypothetical protein
VRQLERKKSERSIIRKLLSSKNKSLQIQHDPFIPVKMHEIIILTYATTWEMLRSKKQRCFSPDGEETSIIRSCGIWQPCR